METYDAARLFEYHRGMLQDFDRVDRYREAIHAVVRPGDVVLDIGTGTGLLAYYACQAGARHVYAIDDGPILALARELSQANGFDDRITFFKDVSYRVTLPERADVLVTETLWNFGIGEGMIGFLADARKRLLKPGARIVPTSVDLYLAPLEHPGLHRMITQMPEDRHGLEFAAMRAYATNQVIIPRVDPSGFLTTPAHLTRIELDEGADANFGVDVAFRAERSGVLHALAGWFESELAPGVRLGNAPPAARSNWAQAVFPLERPIELEAGAEIAVRMDTVANGTGWRWSVRAAGQRLDQTSVFGFPIDTASHQRRASSARPARAPIGDALLFVLTRLDGTASVDDIAQALTDRFDALFMHPGAAAEFVRDAAERYGA
jgi:protein arginine N-methyltransferase 1